MIEKEEEGDDEKWRRWERKRKVKLESEEKGRRGEEETKEEKGKARKEGGEGKGRREGGGMGRRERVDEGEEMSRVRRIEKDKREGKGRG